MPRAMLNDRNGPSKVAEQKENIDKAFADVSAKLLEFNKQIQNSPGAASRITPADKMRLLNSINDVAGTHHAVALEFLKKLKTWAHESLVPEYRNPIDEALRTGEEDIIFQAVSRNFTSFSLITRVTSTIFHNATDQPRVSPNAPEIATPKQILFEAFRDEFYEKIRDRVQGTFFRRLTAIRSSEALTQLDELKPIADIFSDVARSTCLTLDERAASIYKTDYVDKYIHQMVTDNKAAVKEQMTRGVPANEIAGWINRRASFEQQLMSILVAPENDLHRAILDRYNEEVVAECFNDVKSSPTSLYTAEAFHRIRLLQWENVQARQLVDFQTEVRQRIADFQRQKLLSEEERDRQEIQLATLCSTEDFHRSHILQWENAQVRQLIADCQRLKPLSEEELNHQELEKLIFDRSSRDCFIKQVIPLLVENHVTKESFFLLDKDDLREMGVKIGPRKQLLQIIEQEAFRRHNLSARSDLSSRPRSSGHTPRIGVVPSIDLATVIQRHQQQQQLGNAPPLPSASKESDIDEQPRSFVPSNENSEVVSANGGNEYTANSVLESWKSSGYSGSTAKS